MTKRTSKAEKLAKEDTPAAGVNGDVEAKPLAKSADPTFTKFTIYIKKTTHRAVKMRMVDAERELSDLVEELLSGWLKENDSNGD